MSVRLSRAAAILAAALLTGLACTEGQASWFDSWYAHSARGPMVRRAYPVAEFVIPIKDADGRDCRGWAKNDKLVKGSVTCENALIGLIQNTIEPASWTSMGGPGSIDYFPMTMTLVVYQTPDVQEQIADCLAALHRLQNVEVALEVRLVSVNSEFAESPFVTETYLGNADRCPPPGCPIFLDDAQVQKFLEAVVGDQRSNVMQAPKITAFNGQKFRVDCIDKHKFVTGIQMNFRTDPPVCSWNLEEVETGTRIVARPVISADKRSVKLDFKLDLSNIESVGTPRSKLILLTDQGDDPPEEMQKRLQQPKVNTICIEKSLTIPDGKTAIFGGVKREVEGPRPAYPGSRIPYLDRLFKNAGCGHQEQTVYVLVAPRIIVADDDSQESGFRCESMPGR